MGVQFIAVAANAGAALAALKDAAIFVVSAISVSAVVTEAGRSKKEADAAQADEQAARQKAADDFARVGPFADALEKAMERAQEEDCSKRKDCPPLKGRLKWIDRSANSKLSRDYQQYITKFPPNFEWYFEKIHFDGFFPARCELPEAKARYDQFFKNGQPRPFYNIAKDHDEAKRQYNVTKSNPPTILKWYFMTPVYYSYMKNYFSQNGLNIECVLDEMKPTTSD